MNISATVQTIRHLSSNPAFFLPHLTVPTLAHLPLPLSTALAHAHGLPVPPRIEAVVLDKDNCFATPYALEVHENNREAFAHLRKSFPGDRLLIVSNSSGTEGKDKGFLEADKLEKELGVKVLRHALNKPGCGNEIMKFFRRADIGVKGPENVAVIGDRVFTDVLMGNMMGAWSIWIRDGVGSSKPTFVGFLVLLGGGLRIVNLMECSLRVSSASWFRCSSRGGFRRRCRGMIRRSFACILELIPIPAFDDDGL